MSTSDGVVLGLDAHAVKRNSDTSFRVRPFAMLPPVKPFYDG